MIAALLPLALRFLPYIAAVLALAAGWTYADHACWSSACHKYRDRAVSVQAAFDSYVAKQNEIVAAVKAQQEDAVNRVQKLAEELERERGKTFANLRDAAKRAAADRPAVFGGLALRVFDDAAASADAASAGSTGKPAEAASAPADSAEEYVVQLYQWGAEGWARVTEWETFYKGLRDGV